MTNFTEKTYVNLGLMIVIIGAVWYLSATLATIQLQVSLNGTHIEEIKRTLQK